MKNIIQEPKYKVYLIRNIINNKVYVGQTRQKLSKRISGHKEKAKANKGQHHLYNSMNKYGFDSFNVQLLEYCDDAEHLNEREIYWIRFYKSTERQFGYNYQAGGADCRILDPDKRKEMYSTPNSGRRVVGHKRPPEEIFKMLETRKMNLALNPPPPKKEKPYQKPKIKTIDFSLLDDYMLSCRTTEDVAKKYGCCIPFLEKCIRKKYNMTPYQYKIFLLTGNKYDNLDIHQKIYNPIYKEIDLNYVKAELEKLRDLQDIAKELNCSYPTIWTHFKNELGILPEEYVSNYKRTLIIECLNKNMHMKEIVNETKTGVLRIKQICEEVFSEYFYNRYKRLKGQRNDKT